MKGLKLDAEWTNDCFGKKDYDCGIVSLSTRYWPAASGPSAESEILLNHGDGEAITLAKSEFGAETREEVMKQVEEWAQSIFDEIVSLLAKHYKM